MRAGSLFAVCVITAVLAGCGSDTVALDAASIGLREVPTPAALAATTVYTSPDGGIYKNPDHLEVIMAARRDVAAVERRLGSAVGAWAALHRLGAFTLVALRLHDDGKVSSEPQLNALQVASDYAPSGTGTGPLRRFYHPTYPLALLASIEPGDGCSVHLDPGGTVIAILVYPPLQLGAEMVWGSYGDFVLTVPTGGAVPPLSGSLHAVTCAVPVTAPAPT